MKLKLILCVLAALVLAATLNACESGKAKRPFLIAEVCLRTADDLSTFTRDMHSIAESERATFIDRSASTQKELDATGHSLEGARTRQVVNMGVERGNEMLVMVSNLGLPGYQVALGFSEGSNPLLAHRFADAVVRKLEQRWHVETVGNPTEAGAQPMKNCE